MSKKIIGKECKFVTKLPYQKLSKGWSSDDIHIVKERVLYDDGTSERKINVVKDFQMPFYVTKEHYQKHKNKRESAESDSVNTYYSNSKDLLKNVATRLGSRYAGLQNLREVKDSPYVYGLDNNTESIIKSKYMEKFPGINTPYFRCFLDIEVDIPTDVLLVITALFEDSIYCVISSEFVRRFDDPIAELTRMYEKYIPDVPSKSKLKLNFVYGTNEMDCIQKCFKKIHEVKPDIVAIWNMDYDIPKIVDKCIEYDVRPEDLFSDPDLPDEYKYFDYKPALSKKVTESGKVTPVSPEDRWHVVKASSSFYILDAMSTYSFVRVGTAKVPTGYSLDSILKKEVNLTKLKFDDEPKFKGPDWHIYMTREKPLEYIIYNIFDCMSMMELDNKTGDLKNVIALLSGISSFDLFSSGPKKIIDALHVFYGENDLVLGSKGTGKPKPSPLGLGGWIITLMASRLKNNGLKLLEDNPDLNTNIRTEVFDSDVVSAYPLAGMTANVSKDTTLREVISIEGIDKEVFIKENINSMFGTINASHYCSVMYDFPELVDLPNLINEVLEEEKNKDAA